jgi:adenylate cyclase
VRHCDACDIDVEAAFETNVEATFSPEPGVRKAERLVFCHGAPSGVRHWRAQTVVGAASTANVVVPLAAGRYRVQVAGTTRTLDLRVANDAGDHSVAVQLPLAPRTAVQVAQAGDVTFSLDNTDHKPVRMQIVHRAYQSDAATAVDVNQLGLFRDLFGAEAAAIDQRVEVGQVVILFTDLVGSTAMYERIGDARAYATVREHFRLLFDVVHQHSGVVVKTVGDCVMAAFEDVERATRAGAAMVRALATMTNLDGTPTELGLRVGIHAGKALSVRANGQLDYFGRTVNVAARVEGLAAKNEVVLSGTAAQTIDVDALARSVRATPTFGKERVKGVDGLVDVVRLALQQE